MYKKVVLLLVCALWFPIVCQAQEEKKTQTYKKEWIQKEIERLKAQIEILFNQNEWIKKMEEFKLNISQLENKLALKKKEKKKIPKRRKEKIKELFRKIHNLLQEIEELIFKELTPNKDTDRCPRCGR